MKTSKEMQLKIIDKMRENVVNDKRLYADIEYKGGGRWQDKYLPEFYFDDCEMRVKPQTITINGVEIPKPLICSEISSDGDYYYVENSESLHNMSNGTYIKLQGIRFVYRAEQEAIEASKLLFGIKD